LHQRIKVDYSLTTCEVFYKTVEKLLEIGPFDNQAKAKPVEYNFQKLENDAEALEIVMSLAGHKEVEVERDKVLE